MEFTSLHKYIKNIPKNGTILTKHLLNTSGRLCTSKRIRKIPIPLKKKIKEDTVTGKDLAEHLKMGAAYLH